MLAPGKYRGRPVTAALGLTSKGGEQVAVTFELLDPQGERITWYGFFTEKTTDRTIQSLRHCGWQGNDLTVFAEEQLPEGFDQEVELVVEHDTYKDKTTAKVAWVNSGGGMGLKNALSKDQAKSFAERMKRTIDALDKEAGRATAKPAAPPAQRQLAVARPAARPAAPRAAPPPTPSTSDLPQEVLDAQAESNTSEDVPY